MSNYNFVKCTPEEYTAKKGAFKYTGKNSAIIIPDEVTEIKNSSLKNVKAIFVGKNVSVITTNKVEWFEVDQDNPHFSSADGILYNKEKTEILKYPILRKDDSYTIPSTVTRIGEESFEHAVLKKLILHDEILTIGPAAFRYMEKLTEIKWPSKTTTIDNRVLCATGLKSIVLPETIERIEDGAFLSTALESFVIPESVKYLGESVFCGCKNLKKLTFPSKLDKIPKGCCQNCEQLSDVIIPDTVKEIGDRAFYGCNSLKNIKLPSEVVSIGESVFTACKNLKNIVLPNGLVSVGEKAFLYTGIESIEIPSSVEETGTIFSDIKKVIKATLSEKEKDQKQKADQERAETEARYAEIQKGIDKAQKMLDDLKESLNQYKKNAERLTKKRLQMTQRIQDAELSGNMSLYKSLLLEANEIPQNPIFIFAGPRHTVKLYSKNNIDGTYAIEQDGILHVQNLCEFEAIVDQEVGSSVDASELDRAIMAGIAGGAFLGYLATSAARTYFYATAKFTLLSKDGSMCRVVMMDCDKVLSEPGQKMMYQVNEFCELIAQMADNTQEDIKGYSYIADNKAEIMQAIAEEEKKMAEKAKNEAAARAEKKRIEREKAQERFNNYWKAHEKEKTALESEKQTLKEQIKSIQNDCNDQIKDLEKSLSEIPGETEITNIEERISKLTAEKDALGIFKGKQKKALQAEIDDLTTEKKNIQSRMSAAKSEIEQKINAVKADAKNKIAKLQKRCAEIDNELTKER